jgi:beta-lactamase superfamily II metal-dependent hydrolase
MLRLEMLPAEHGDALLLEYGAGTEATHRSLIDGGPGNAYAGVRQRLMQIPPAPDGTRHLELLVVSHVDADHIDGVVKMVQDEELALSVGDVWFNDWNHIATLQKSKPPDHLGPGAGEFLGALLDTEDQPWNAAFGMAGVMVPDDPAQPLQCWTTPGGLSLTVVSPTVDTLIKLRANWRSAIEAAGFSPGDRTSALRQFQRMRLRTQTLGDESRRGTLDHAEANGSSIALVAEFGGRRLLLGADAFPDVLRAGVERWVRERGGAGDGRMPLDGFKLPHHGSENNMTPQLMSVLEADDYLISTNGKRFRHPNREAMEQVIAGHARPDLPRLRFNYLTPYTHPWQDSDACRSFYGPAAVLDLTTS